MLKEVEGNIIDLAIQDHFDVIVHGCNCFCVMGAGLAKEIKNRIPQAFTADCLTRPGDNSKLGTYTKAIHGNIFGKKFTVVNAYTQYHYRWVDGKAPFNSSAFIKVLDLVKQEFSGKRIAFPLIGAGLAGGNWEQIKHMINTCFQDEDVTIVHFKD